ncbi:MAG: hypothetical protein AAGE76_12090 [Pseudomonadota bacterium]
MARLLPGVVQTVVICNGDALVTITIDANGQPISADWEKKAPCLLTADTVADAPPADWHRFVGAWTWIARPDAFRRADQDAFRNGFARAPPAQG